MYAQGDRPESIKVEVCRGTCMQVNISNENSESLICGADY